LFEEGRIAESWKEGERNVPRFTKLNLSLEDEHSESNGLAKRHKQKDDVVHYNITVQAVKERARYTKNSHRPHREHKPEQDTLQ
jgi:hypothetical protein